MHPSPSNTLLAQILRTAPFLPCCCRAAFDFGTYPPASGHFRRERLEARQNIILELSGLAWREVGTLRAASWGGGPMQTLLQDLRYGIRMLAKWAGFAAIAIVALALGIGATTALFSVINGVLLSPLPFPQSDQLI